MNSLRASLLIALLIGANTSSNAQIPPQNSYPSAKATVYLDFDGQLVTGTVWNWSGPVYAQPAGLSAEAVQDIFERVSTDFRPFRLNITTDSSVYKAAPLHQRIRVIITPTNGWHGNSAGAACIGSFSWGDETPAWVFNTLLGDDPKYIASCASHEIGHALGLLDQSTYDLDGHKISPYAIGAPGASGWSPIMGVSLYTGCSVWQKGPSSLGLSRVQDDLDIIAHGHNDIGFRSDDYSDDITQAPLVKPEGKQFAIRGLINFAGDRDAFRFQIATAGQLLVGYIPTNIDSELAKINIRLLSAKGRELAFYPWQGLRENPVTALLDSGTYYLVVEDAGNQVSLRCQRPVYYALSAMLLTPQDLQHVASRPQIPCLDHTGSPTEPSTRLTPSEEANAAGGLSVALERAKR